MTETGCLGFQPLAVMCTYLHVVVVHVFLFAAMKLPRAMVTDAPAGAVLVGNTVVAGSVVGNAVVAGNVVVAAVAVGGAVGDTVDDVVLDPPTASVLDCVTLVCDALVQPTSRAALISAADAMRGVVRMDEV